MIDCKITENYLREKKRMCKSIERCCDCPLYDYDCGPVADTDSIVAVIEIVQEWSDTHAPNTYLSDFLEKYPKAKLLSTGIPYDVCVKRLYVETDCNNDCKACWNTPLDEVRK